MVNLVEQLNDEMADVVELVKQTLVQVSNGTQSQGAGIIISSNGQILTNAHVVRQHTMQVKLPDGELVSASVLAHDTERDLALLKIEAEALPFMQLSEGDDLNAGQWVTAVGHPWGIAGAVTSGVLIDGGSHIIEQRGNSRGWLAASLHLRPGNSGGPLVDVEGRLLGINTVMAGPEVGLAIPADVIRSFLADVAQLRAEADLPNDAPPEQPQIV